MQNTQTLITKIPAAEQQAFKELAQEIRSKYLDKHAFWLALADAFESELGIQDGITLPDVGRKLEAEIFDQQLLGAIEE